MSTASEPSSSYANIPAPPGEEDVDSLPSSSAGSSTSASPSEDGDYSSSDAEREWRESLQQLELLLTMVLVPYLGKYFGRKCAYWGWAKFMMWKYPVSVTITNPGLFKGAGAIEAAASL
ncbi:hypothetical protein LTR85_008541 [Meristemomyces frigidus]|nr:hypothetical protein LTR85_008541 [Meristemomyces frigidus]